MKNWTYSKQVKFYLKILIRFWIHAVWYLILMWTVVRLFRTALLFVNFATEQSCVFRVVIGSPFDASETVCGIFVVLLLEFLICPRKSLVLLLIESMTWKRGCQENNSGAKWVAFLDDWKLYDELYTRVYFILIFKIDLLFITNCT